MGQAAFLLTGRAAAAPSQPRHAFRLAAAALAALPVGFAVGTLVGARLLAPAEAVPGMQGVAAPALAIAGCGAFGAAALALFSGGAAMALHPRAARVLTFVLGGASFAVMVYATRHFMVDRMAQSRAFDAAYAQVPPFAFSLATGNAGRRPFSALAYEGHAYRAVRPGGWHCEGDGRRRDHLALFEALRELEPAVSEACPQRVAWRRGDVPEKSACIAVDAPLLAAADAMVEATARRAVCRRSLADIPGS